MVKRVVITALTSLLIATIASAQSEDQVLIWQEASMVVPSASNKGRSIDRRIIETPVSRTVFENAVNSAVRSLENTIRKTCATELKASIAVSAEGKWAIVGVSISGAMEVTVQNPELNKNCNKKR